MQAHIEAFFDPTTCTVSYIVYDHPSGSAAIIDPVLDYDPKSGRTSTASADKLLRFLDQYQLSLQWILETHAHADHLSAAHMLQQQRGGQIAIGAHIGQVQSAFKDLFHLEPEFATDGAQFDVLLRDGQQFAIGELQATALFVPGHTPADMAYQIGADVFVGDTLFMPDVGTARCDFPGGDAHALYRSIQTLLSLPATTRLHMCHDYPPLYPGSNAARPPAWQTTVADQRSYNIHVHDGVDAAQFVAMRTQRDAGLDMPVLILPSIQINIRAGHFPPAESNGKRYLKIPLNAL